MNANDIFSEHNLIGASGERREECTVVEDKLNERGDVHDSTAEPELQQIQYSTPEYIKK